MAAISNHIIDALVDLVENELLRLSSEGQDGCSEYRTLQDSRSALLVLAGEQTGTHGIAPKAAAAPSRPRVHYLRAIEGGKA